MKLQAKARLSATESKSKIRNPFEGGRKAASVTQRHVPLIWENMLGTIYARSPAGKTEYFDYDYDAAHAFAEVSKCSDLRIAKAPRTMNMGDDQYITKGQSVLYGLHPQ